LNTLNKQGPERWLMRKLQRYTVTIHRREAMKLLAQGDIKEIIPGLYVQVSDWLYDPDLGLNLDGMPSKPENCIA
jgi:CRISPR-associated endonuclease/helicase Cas3